MLFSAERNSFQSRLLLLVLLSLFISIATTDVHSEQKKNRKGSKRITRKVDSSIELLKDSLSSFFSDTTFNNTFWGVRIESLTKNQVLFQLNGEKNFVPASNQKLLTAAAAMSYIDTNYHYTTTAYRTGELLIYENGTKTLNGDLVIRSNGNPCHAMNWIDSVHADFFQQIADSLLKDSITQISGNLIGDDADFESSPLSESITTGEGDYNSDWSWGDIAEGVSPSSSLAYNFNKVEVNVLASEEGKLPRVFLSPETDFMTIENKAITTGESKSRRDLKISRRLGTNTIVISGQMPLKSREIKEMLSVESPTLYFLSSLKLSLEHRGIRVLGQVQRKRIIDAFDYKSLPVVVEWASPNLVEVISFFNKESHNFTAEQVLRTLGKSFRGEASSDAGLAAIESYLLSIGIEKKNFVVIDACGLSRKNRISPSAILTVLRHQYHTTKFDAFRRTLAIAGVDGTMEDRLRKSKAKGKCFAKTGYVGGVRTLSGYLQHGNEWIAFSIMAMNFTQPRISIEEVQDHVIDYLSNWER